MTAKWTLGELKQIVADEDKALMKEVLEYLIDRGPGVVDWESDGRVVRDDEDQGR